MSRDNHKPDNPKIVELKHFGEILLQANDIRIIRSRLRGMVAGYSRTKILTPEKQRRIRAYYGVLEAIK